MARTILAYGKTRTYKTSQFRFIAERVWAATGKKSRFVTTDVGSKWEPIQDLVEAGIVQPLFIPVDPVYNCQPAVRKIRKGMWPSEGKLLPTVGGKNPTTWLTPAQQKDFAEIGAMGLESLHSFGNGVMRDLREKNIVIGKDDVPGLREEDGEKFAANTRGHYSAAHNEILDLLQWMGDAPYEYVYLTSLEGIGEDDDGPVRRAVLGPKAPGKAITEVIPSMVNDCLHLQEIAGKSGNEVRCYVRSHPSDIPSKLWPAGMRNLSIPTVLAAVQRKWPEGFFALTPEKGISAYLDFLDEIAPMVKEYHANLKRGGGSR